MAISIDPRLVTLAIQNLPGVIAWIRSAFVSAHPDVVPPTDEEVLAAYLTAFKSSIAVDDAWLLAHPVPPVVS
jgi:hypothetical protein